MAKFDTGTIYMRVTALEEKLNHLVHILEATLGNPAIGWTLDNQVAPKSARYVVRRFQLSYEVLDTFTDSSVPVAIFFTDVGYPAKSEARRLADILNQRSTEP